MVMIPTGLNAQAQEDFELFIARNARPQVKPKYSLFWEDMNFTQDGLDFELRGYYTTSGNPVTIYFGKDALTYEDDGTTGTAIGDDDVETEAAPAAEITMTDMSGVTPLMIGSNPRLVITDEIGFTVKPDGVSIEVTGEFVLPIPDGVKPYVFAPEPEKIAVTHLQNRFNLNASDEIHSMLCLSAAHITQETNEDFYTGTMDHVVAYEKMDVGHFVPVIDDDENYPDDLRAILAYARARGCTWIMLDQDGPVVDGLKTWEW